MTQKSNILIIGAGISGLSCLHFLKRKNPNVDVVLLEKNPHAGGTIRSRREDGFLFEHGPNGILAQPLILEMFEQLGLSAHMIKASEAAKKRYVLKNGKLNPVPGHPKDFFQSNYLSAAEKCRAVCEMFVPKSFVPDETIYDFARRRFGTAVAEKLFDPMVKGIFGGDARRLHLRSVFSKVDRMEQQHGSVFRALMKGKKEKGAVPFKRTLVSFREGMQTVIDALVEKYSRHIRCGVEVQNISTGASGRSRFVIQTSSGLFEADHVILCAPAFAAAKLLQGYDSELSRLLGQIEYAPIVVTGMGFERPPTRFSAVGGADFTKRGRGGVPEAYGYLVASSEKSPVLGALFEDQIFEGRASENRALLRVMLGGSDHPEIVRDSPETIQSIALNHLEKVLGLRQKPQKFFLKIWPQAIPQYTLEYADVIRKARGRLENHPGLNLLANYLGGVSFNDCVENASQLAERF